MRHIREMGHSVTAEGIENETMAQMMLELGCDYQQGYAYSRPLPADEFLEYCSRMKK